MDNAPKAQSAHEDHYPNARWRQSQRSSEQCDVYQARRRGTSLQQPRSQLAGVLVEAEIHAVVFVRGHARVHSTFDVLWRACCNWKYVLIFSRLLNFRWTSKIKYLVYLHWSCLVAIKKMSVSAYLTNLIATEKKRELFYKINTCIPLLLKIW